MKPKLVFFDIDGTLKPFTTKTPTSTKQAIERLKENGHIPVICTGRCLAAVNHDEDLLSLGCSGMICSAGNQIIVNHETVYQKSLENDTIEMISSVLEQCEMPYMLEGEHALYYHPRFEEECKKTWGAVLGDIPMEEYKKDCDSIQKCMAIYAHLLKESDKISELEKEMNLLWYKNPGNVVEMIPKNTSKATGIHKLMEHLQIPVEDTYAFGDGPNDMEMIEYVAHGVAMGNADDELKEVADYVTGPCDGDGIYDALKKYGLI